MRRKRFYEEEIDTEEIDDIDDIDDEIDEIDDEIEEPLSTETRDISSQIKSIVDREINRIQTRDIPSSPQVDSSKENIVNKDTSHISSTQKGPSSSPGPKHNNPIPHHSSPSPNLSYPSKKPHRHKGHKGSKRNTQPPKSPSKPHINVVYKHLFPIIYPTNTRPLMRFNHHINGNFIICSPITGNDNPTIQMKKLFLLRRLCIENGYKYLFIYSLDEYDRLIDISLIVFPHTQTEKEYLILKKSIYSFVFGFSFGSFIGCYDGFYTLYTPQRIIHYTYPKKDIEKVITKYTKNRGIKTQDSCRYFLNPYPQSKQEYDYRTSVGEICVREKKV